MPTLYRPDASFPFILWNFQREKFVCRTKMILYTIRWQSSSSTIHFHPLLLSRIIVKFVKWHIENDSEKTAMASHNKKKKMKRRKKNEHFPAKVVVKQAPGSRRIQWWEKPLWLIAKMSDVSFHIVLFLSIYLSMVHLEVEHSDVSQTCNTHNIQSSNACIAHTVLFVIIPPLNVSSLHHVWLHSLLCYSPVKKW